MLDSDAIKLEILATHYIGNSANGEHLELSKEPVDIEEAGLQQALKQYFLTPFQLEDSWHFFHSSDIRLNEICHFAGEIFNDREQFFINGCNIARHLYGVTTNPNIKSGELHVALFSGVPAEGKIVDAIGIYKTDSRETFLKISQGKGRYSIAAEEGVSLAKMDKGCFIFNIHEADGYKLHIVDKTNKGGEAVFWKDTFLNVRPDIDDYHQTEDYLKLAKSFITEQVPAEYEVTSVDKINLLNKSVSYFKENETFDRDNFADTVFSDEELKQSFTRYETQYKEDFSISVDDSFEINNAAFKKNKNMFREVIKLDKNFHIYVHGNTDLIEKGYDEETGKHFYKLYFDNED